MKVNYTKRETQVCSRSRQNSKKRFWKLIAVTWRWYRWNANWWKCTTGSFNKFSGRFMAYIEKSDHILMQIGLCCKSERLKRPPDRQ